MCTNDASILGCGSTTCTAHARTCVAFGGLQRYCSSGILEFGMLFCAHTATRTDQDRLLLETTQDRCISTLSGESVSLVSYKLYKSEEGIRPRGQYRETDHSILACCESDQYPRAHFGPF